MIKFKNVTKIYSLQAKKNNTLKELFAFSNKSKRDNSTFIALDNLSFVIPTGSCAGILGKNGSGKSSILKLVSKITLPTSGEIELYGKISSLLEVGAGFHLELSGYENIYLSGAILGLSRKETHKKIDGIINFADIGSFLFEPVKNYSSGMMLRLAFSIGISLESDILVIDEALSVGDDSFRIKCLNKIDEIIKSGKTVLFVSHDIEQLKKICNLAMVLDKGKLIHCGDVDLAANIYENLLKKGEKYGDHIS